MPGKTIHPIKIGNLEITNNLWLAPMAGYSHKALRLFARKFGAGFAFTEMVSLEGLVRGDKKTLSYLDITGEDFTVIQLFGKCEPEKYIRASKLLQENYGAKLIDVNFGCPVRKVIRNEAGSYLLTTPEAMGNIIKALKDSGVYASAKIRSGFDRITLEESIAALNSAGADIITLHPRLATQFYNGKADWTQIAQARSMTDKILIASGDMKKPEDVKAVFDLTGADGVMIGRQAVGAAYIFSQTLEYFQTGSYHQYSLEEIKEIMLEFTSLFIKLRKEDWIVPIRSDLIQYVRLFKNSKEIRCRLSGIETSAELAEILKEW